MENILEQLEIIIDDIERDDTMDKDEILQVLNKLKNEIEDYQLNQEGRETLNWEDLD